MTSKGASDASVHIKINVLEKITWGVERLLCYALVLGKEAERIESLLAIKEEGAQEEKILAGSSQGKRRFEVLGF